MSFAGIPNNGPARDPWNRVIKEDGGNNNNSNNNNNQQPPPKTGGNASDNTGVDDQTIDNIWNEIEKENGKGSGDQTQQQQQQNNTQAPKPEEQVQAYLDSIGLKAVALSEQDKTDLQAGNFDNVLAKLNTNIANAHIQAIKSANTMIEGKVKAAVDEAVKQSKSYISGTKALDQLHKDLPFTSDPIISPVAQTVLQRFLDRGKSLPEAIKGVKLYYDRVNQKMNPSRVNANLSGNFRGAPEDLGQSEVDWLSLISPGRG